MPVTDTPQNPKDAGAKPPFPQDKIAPPGTEAEITP